MTRGLLLDDTLDVDDILQTVDGSDLALAVLAAATDNKNLIILADGHGTDIVLLAELLTERCTHDGASDAGWSIEVCLAGLSP